MVLYNNRTNDFDGSGPTFELGSSGGTCERVVPFQSSCSSIVVHREGNDNPRNYSNQKLWATNFWHVCMSSDTKLLEHKEQRRT